MGVTTTTNSAATYVPIATNTLSGSQATVTFSSIPATYTDLVLVIFPNETGTSSNINMTFNSDTATNYSRTSLYGNGTVAGSARNSNAANIGITPLIGTGSDTNIIINVMNYSNTTTYKTVLERGNQVSVGTVAQVGLWRSTSAINRIDLANASGNFITGSTFSLYGIKGA